MRGLKDDPRTVVVAAIAGEVDLARTAVIGPDPDTAERPFLQPSCTGAPGIAAPGLRLQSFLEGFRDRAFAASACEDNQRDALEGFGRLIRTAQGDACIAQPLVDADANTAGLQARCEVTQYTVTGGERSDPVSVPACGGSGLPCWKIVNDVVECRDAPDGLTLQIERSGPAPVGTEIEARCQVEEL